MFDISVPGDCLMDNIEEPFAEFQNHVFIEDILPDQVTHETSEILDVDDVLVDIDVLYQHVGIVAEHDVDKVEFSIAGEFLLLRKQIDEALLDELMVIFLL